MEVRLTPDQEAFVRQAIESGRFHRAEDAVEEALLLWEERERKRAEFLATLDDAKASLARGEGRNITQESMRDLAEEVKQRGQVRLAAEQIFAPLMAHRVSPQAALFLPAVISLIPDHLEHRETSSGSAGLLPNPSNARPVVLGYHLPWTIKWQHLEA